MELYRKTSYQIARRLTRNYSTSFSLAVRILPNWQRQHIYAIYALARVSDEIVDTYDGPDEQQLLDQLEAEVLSALTSGYSPNPVVFAFTETMRRYDIDFQLVKDFYTSMRMDIHQQWHNPQTQQQYIHGSAQVIGRMCLQVLYKDAAQDGAMISGAESLGSALQKVNFLRDMGDDFFRLGRAYFPGVDIENLDVDDIAAIVSEVESEFEAAMQSLLRLPPRPRLAVYLVVLNYRTLLRRIKRTPPQQLAQKRIRVPGPVKALLLVRAYVTVWFQVR